MLLRLQIVLFCLVLIAGCFPGSKPPYLVEHYTIDYAYPVIKGVNHIEASITVDRFTVAQFFNSRAMVYQPAANQLASYTYNKWSVNPGDMVTDYLLRDLRNAGIFQAVFSYRDSVRTRYMLEGGVEQFMQVTEKGNQRAVLSLTVTLIDTKENEINRKIVFQKTYLFVETLSENSPVALARGLSAGMAKFSEQLIKDIYEAAKDRV